MFHSLDFQLTIVWYHFHAFELLLFENICSALCISFVFIYYLLIKQNLHGIQLTPTEHQNLEYILPFK